jgi:DNA-binding NarL/FixJ family response regulator
MTRILIADDNESMRNALIAIIKLRPCWEVCGQATDGREVVAKAVELHPDLIILDFKMHIANGITAGSQIARSLPNTPILMCTLYKSRHLEVAAKMVGIRQVVAKEDGPQSLLDAIETELSGPAHIH